MNQTVQGVKTFSGAVNVTGIILVPTPTANMQAATKKYVDDVASGGTWTALSSTNISSEFDGLFTASGSIFFANKDIEISVAYRINSQAINTSMGVYYIPKGGVVPDEIAIVGFFDSTTATWGTCTIPVASFATSHSTVKMTIYRMSSSSSSSTGSWASTSDVTCNITDSPLSPTTNAAYVCIRYR